MQQGLRQLIALACETDSTFFAKALSSTPRIFVDAVPEQVQKYVPKYNFWHRCISTMKEWTEPQLTILIRGKNEESVLIACKTMNVVSSGALNDNNMCEEKATFNCAAICSASMPS